MSTAVQNVVSVQSSAPGKSRVATAPVSEEPFEKVLSTARKKDSAAEAASRKTPLKGRSTGKADRASRGKSRDEAEAVEQHAEHEVAAADEAQTLTDEMSSAPADEAPNPKATEGKKGDSSAVDETDDDAAQAEAGSQCVLATAVQAISASGEDPDQEPSGQSQQGDGPDEAIPTVGAADAMKIGNLSAGATAVDEAAASSAKSAEIVGKNAGLAASAGASAELAVPAEEDTSLSSQAGTLKLPDLPLADTNGSSPAAKAIEAVTQLADSLKTIADDVTAATTQAQSAAAAPGHAADTTAKVQTPAAPAPVPETEFAQANHEKIVTGIRSQLVPGGGTMQIRLDPPELGALQVMVEMRDGVMTATFQTSNDQATQLLSHSLNQLKTVLEGQGVTVERLQVQQAPKNEKSSAGQDQQNPQQQNPDDNASRQEQQRKEMLRRMWRKISGAGDPIDYLA